MIELHRPPDSAAADEIHAALRSMVVAFEVVEDDALPAPQIHDAGTVHSGADDIAAFLDRLRRDVELWNAFQSDTCYIGEDGRVC